MNNTPTETLPSGFPSSSVRDTFNRANGAPGANWSGSASGYSIVSNRLDMGSGTPLLWNLTSFASNQGTITNFSSATWQPESFGADQEAYVTLVHVDPNGGEQDLLLKETNDGLIEVLYDATHDDIGVWTYSEAQGWVRHGDYILVTFNDGDQFGARALANGDVEVYKNGTLIGMRNVSSWEYFAGGGRIGIWFVDVTGALLDDFGGGTLSGGEGLMAQGSSFIEGDDLLEKLQANPKPTRTPSPTGTPTATQTPAPPQSGFDLNPIANFAPVSFKLPAPALDTWNQTLETLVIDYTYDPLNRLTSATYSDGRNFAYTYDASGNVLELQQNLGPGTIITAYAYDEANQLNTAQQGSTIWQYTYDANGSLISDGVKNYTYDSANRLVEISEQSTVTSLSYNGLGQRLSMDAAGVIATYVLDGNQPLTAESNGNTTFYLYGLPSVSIMVRQTSPIN